MSIQTSARRTKRQIRPPRRIAGTTKVVFTIDQSVLLQLDCLVKRKGFPSRSKAIQEAIRDKLARANHARLAAECAKLNPRVEQAFAEEGMATELAAWPKY
jgi:Arc/MetJ-type ribon-helix-helix transcriptional regulator